MERSLKKSMSKSSKNLLNMFPLLMGTVFLLGLFMKIMPESFYGVLFGRNFLLDALAGSALGSAMVGNPITSHIIGGELLKKGIGLAAVTAFVIAWVTVGMVQIPIEAKALGKKFTFWRNVMGFISAALIGIATALIMKII